MRRHRKSRGVSANPTDAARMPKGTHARLRFRVAPRFATVGLCSPLPQTVAHAQSFQRCTPPSGPSVGKQWLASRWRDSERVALASTCNAAPLEERRPTENEVLRVRFGHAQGVCFRKYALAATKLWRTEICNAGLVRSGGARAHLRQ